MAASVVSGVRCLLRRASYRSGYLTLRYTDMYVYVCIILPGFVSYRFLAVMGII